MTFCIPEAQLEDLFLSFCFAVLYAGSCEEAEEKLGAVAKPAPSPAPGAKMISLCTTSRAGGTVLGCFTLDLPRTHPENVLHAPMRANLKLPCHAFGDKLVLARLTDDLDEAELMRFFSKQGATGAIVAHARACSFASVSFASIADVARFLGRIAHAFADDRGTLVARLLPLDPKLDAIATLPALPAPQLSAKDQAVVRILKQGHCLCCGPH